MDDFEYCNEIVSSEFCYITLGAAAAEAVPPALVAVGMGGGPGAGRGLEATAGACDSMGSPPSA